jgi:hypothetical protein
VVPFTAVSTEITPVFVRHLTAAGALDTVDGQLALVLAERIESPGQTGSAVAALHAELRRLMTVIDARVKVEDPLDKLRRRRDRRRGDTPA